MWNTWSVKGFWWLSCYFVSSICWVCSGFIVYLVLSLLMSVHSLIAGCLAVAFPCCSSSSSCKHHCLLCLIELDLLDVRRLMGCLMYRHRLAHSPYSSLLSEGLWDEARTSFRRIACELMDLPLDSPLATWYGAMAFLIFLSLPISLQLFARSIKREE